MARTTNKTHRNALALTVALTMENFLDFISGGKTWDDLKAYFGLGKSKIKSQLKKWRIKCADKDGLIVVVGATT